MPVNWKKTFACVLHWVSQLFLHQDSPPHFLFFKFSYREDVCNCGGQPVYEIF